MKNIGWYVAHSHIINVDEWDEMTTGNQRWTGRVWGWDCGSGITAMVIPGGHRARPDTGGGVRGDACNNA
ncbi:MAG: hypothetical protein KAV00_05245 [Phycisphaerae bacterium]|nr:hypothetical protein [Phycisphaerae bacterium]